MSVREPLFHGPPLLRGHFLYLELDVVTDELVALHELPLVAPVLRDHREGVVDGGAEDADQGLDAGVRVDVGQVGLHDVTGSKSGGGREVLQPHDGTRGTGSSRDMAVPPLRTAWTTRVPLLNHLQPILEHTCSLVLLSPSYALYAI